MNNTFKKLLFQIKYSEDKPYISIIGILSTTIKNTFLIFN